MNIETNIRKIAKQVKYLNLFSASKELSGIRLFKNSDNFSKIQDIFLSYLYFYYNINMDISSDKVSKKVLDNEINENAYMIYRNNTKIDKKEKDKNGNHLYLVFGKDKLKEG